MKTGYDFRELGMETKKNGKGLYTITYMGYEFMVTKEWISKKWTYNQMNTIKGHEDTWIEGNVSTMTECKLSIMHTLDSLFSVNY